MYSVYGIHFQNIHTFTYQKAVLHTFFLLDFKIVKNLQCILNGRAVVEGLVAKNLVDKKMDLLLNYWQLKTYIKLHIQTVHFPFQ